MEFSTKKIQLAVFNLIKLPKKVIRGSIRFKVIRRPWGACWMVSVTERVKTLFFSPLQPRNAGGGGGGRGGGG